VLQVSKSLKFLSDGNQDRKINMFWKLMLLPKNVTSVTAKEIPGSAPVRASSYSKSVQLKVEIDLNMRKG
jgi:hypothetical protein